MTLADSEVALNWLPGLLPPFKQTPNRRLHPMIRRPLSRQSTTSKSSGNYQPGCLFDHSQPVVWLRSKVLLVNKRNSRPFSYHQCFCVGLRIGLIREHFCVNWLNLEAIWRLPRRHMLRAPSHLSSGKARGEMGDLRQSYPISKQAEHESHQFNIVHTNILATAQGIFPS